MIPHNSHFYQMMHVTPVILEPARNSKDKH